MTSQNSAAAYVYDDAMSGHLLREDHPMRPVRLRYTYQLLEAYGAFNSESSLLVEPRSATVEELLTTHTLEYVQAVEHYSAGRADRTVAEYGFSERGDNPVYPGMYQAALISTGASVQAAELVADGQVRVAFNPAGGLHHAAAANASGFCIFNDPAVAINALRRRGLRVVYVDIDAHHGDGVQNAFYADADVLTISLHESGRYLFPGTGDVDELGVGEGRGFSVNLPLFPYTGDQLYLEAFKAVVPPLVDAFKPDVLVTQLGIDTYVTDPLTHLALSSGGYVQVVEALGAMGYPWLAFGGGGYDLGAVARCWTLAYGVMIGREWPDTIPEAGREGIDKALLRDTEMPRIEGAVCQQAQLFAEESIELVRRAVFPLHGISI
jgi:acetoin utilization protein AcuC